MAPASAASNFGAGQWNYQDASTTMDRASFPQLPQRHQRFLEILVTYSETKAKSHGEVVFSRRDRRFVLLRFHELQELLAKLAHLRRRRTLRDELEIGVEIL